MKLDITEKDLVLIHSYAVKKAVDLTYKSSHHADNAKLLAYSWTAAVIMYLQSKGFELNAEIVNGA